MAISATNFTNVRRRQLAPGEWRVTGTFTGPTSYTSGGETLTNALCKAVTGINKIEEMDFAAGVDTTNNLGLNITFDHVWVQGVSQGKIRCFLAGGTAADGSTEMTATHNLSTYSTKFEAIGC